MELQIGQLIAAPFLPVSAEVKKFESRPGYYRLEVLLRDGSNQYLSQNIGRQRNLHSRQRRGGQGGQAEGGARPAILNPRRNTQRHEG